MSSRRGRGVGLSAFQNRSSLTSSYATHGAALRETQNSSLSAQLSVLQELLHTIALEHAESIKANPTYQKEFARMCTAVGVDPLAGSNSAGKKKGKGWWTQVFGGDDADFYFAVGVRVVEVCRASRGENGGLLGVGECRERVRKGRGIGGGIEVNDVDVLRAVKDLAPLGSGFSIVTIGSKQMIRSVPKELNTDQSRVLEVIQMLGYVTVSMLEDNLQWENARAQTAMEDLIADSLVWVDEKAPEKEYWSPAYLDDFDD